MPADSHHGDVNVARLSGDYDVTRAKELRAQLATAIGGAEFAVVDCSGVTYFDSIGIAELVRLYKIIRANKDFTTPRLVIASKGVRRIFEVAGLEKLFDIYDDLESATAGLTVVP